MQITVFYCNNKLILLCVSTFFFYPTLHEEMGWKPMRKNTALYLSNTILVALCLAPTYIHMLFNLLITRIQKLNLKFLF